MQTVLRTKMGIQIGTMELGSQVPPTYSSQCSHIHVQYMPSQPDQTEKETDRGWKEERENRRKMLISNLPAKKKDGITMVVAKVYHNLLLLIFF